MRQRITKAPKIALCRVCRGAGHLRRKEADGTYTTLRCPQCEGSGRVTVSAVMECDIRPYRPK